MITKLVVSNYRSLGESVEIPLGQLTALVGINSAGKSAILDVLRFLSDCVRDGVAAALTKRNGLGAIRRRCETPNLPVTIRTEMRFDLGEAFWEFSLQEDERGDYIIGHETGRWEPDYEAGRVPEIEFVRSVISESAADNNHWQGHLIQLEAGAKPSLLPSNRPGQFEVKSGELKWNHNKEREVWDQTALVLPTRRKEFCKDVANLLRSISCYTIFPDQLRPPQKPDSVRRPMDEHGTNWTSTLRRLKKEGAGQELLAALGRIVGDINDYRVTAVGGYLVTEFQHGKKQWLDASAESDGTLRIAGLLTALLQEPAPTVLGIEEPELTVHPGALPVLFDFLREASKRSQIVLSTHSPDLLDLLDVEELLVVSRGETTTVAKVASEQRTAVRQHLLSTSDLMRAEGLRPEPAPPPAEGSRG